MCLSWSWELFLSVVAVRKRKNINYSEYYLIIIYVMYLWTLHYILLFFSRGSIQRVSSRCFCFFSSSIYYFFLYSKTPALCILTMHHTLTIFLRLKPLQRSPMWKLKPSPGRGNPLSGKRNRNEVNDRWFYETDVVLLVCHKVHKTDSICIQSLIASFQRRKSSGPTIIIW